MTEYESILQKYWGYPKFRALQQEIIESVCSGNDTLGLMPTGGGKSITFQVAALSKPGICIVITPLIALMKDQVDNLQRRQIKALAVYSGMTPNQIETALDNCILGDYKFLYVSPERLKTRLFLAKAKQMKVNLIAVDESHCISQWGYDFRPSYLEIANFRDLFPRVPVLALTATATPDVVADIQEKLHFKAPNCLQKSFERKNLTYMVLKRNDKLGTLFKICEKNQGAGIVYVRTRKETVEVAYALQQKGFTADFYHAGLDLKTRTKKQSNWALLPNIIMVCTNAFGMGIDKPNVRFVVHLNIPESLEAYFQEAGRAGRDEKESNAFLIYNELDLQTVKDNFTAKYPSFDYIRKVYDSLGNYCSVAVGEGAGTTHDFNLLDFCRKFNLSPVETVNAMAILEEEEYLVSTEVNEATSKVQILYSRDDLYRFQVTNPNMDAFLKLLLRTYSGLFTECTRIYETELARISGADVEIIKKFLVHLSKIGVLFYQPARQNPVIFFQNDREFAEQMKFNTKRINERKERQQKRLEAMLNYVASTNKCRSELLLEYFGEKQSTRCGNCDVCRTRNKVQVSELTFDYVVEDLKKVISNEPQTLDEIIAKSIVKDVEQIKNVIKFLLDKQKIRYVSGSRLLWN